MSERDMAEDVLDEAVERIAGSELLLLTLAESDHVQGDAKCALATIAGVLEDVGRGLASISV